MKDLRVLWPVLLILALSFLLTSCGGGGGGASSGGDTSTIPVGSGDGSSSNPAALTVGTPSSGSIGVGGVSYYSFTPSSSGFYTITVTGATTSLSWVLFSDAGFKNAVKSCSSYSSPTLAAFADLTGGTAYYLMVNNYSTGSGSFYTVTVTAGGGNEGNIGSPVLLTVGTPHNATISSDGKGYYSFVADRDGSFIIGLTDTHQDLRWSLYSNASYTAYVVFSCDTTSYAGDEICATPNLVNGQSYYLLVEEQGYKDGFFTITVSPGASEGSVSGPVHLTVGTSHVGGIENGGTSYYRFTTNANATSSYTIAVSNVTPTATLTILVYSDPAFSYGSEVATCYSSAQCLASGLGPATAYYVKVMNATAISGGQSSTYSIVVIPGGSEGYPAGPVALTVGQATAASVDGKSSSYYAFTTADTGVGGSYTVSLTNTQTNLSWTVYSDAGFTTSLGSCDTVTTAGAGDETCATANLDPNTTYYLKVSNAEAAASSFTLQAAAGGGNEGSKNYPYPLTPGAAHNGYVVKYATSYYKFTTGSSAMTYRISLTNMQTSLGWRLYSDAVFTTDISPVCLMGTGTADKICSTTQSSYGVLNANTAYYLAVESNTSGNISSSYAVTVAPLDPASGCGGGAAECFSFQDGLLPASFVLTYPGNQFTKWGIDAANNGGASPGTGSSMKSGSISVGQSTCFEYTRTGTAEVLFSLKQDAASMNALEFYINGSAYHYWYDPVAWRRAWFSTPSLAGVSSTVYKWCYKKDNGTVTGADAVWVDDIEFK